MRGVNFLRKTTRESESWVDAFFQFTKMALWYPDTVAKVMDKGGYDAVKEWLINLTNEFEELTRGYDWDSVDYYDTVRRFYVDQTEE